MDSKSLRYEEDIINAFVRGEIITVNEGWIYNTYFNNLAKQAAELVPNCLGICYAFNNQISLVIGQDNVPQ